MRPLPLFPVTTVGSWPRTQAVLDAQKGRASGKVSAAEWEKVCDESVLELVRMQEEAGLDLLTDGEQRRDNFYSFVAEKLTGVKMMSLAEMLEIIEDKAAFERILQTLDVPAYSISNPTCVGKVSRKEPLAVGELRFLRKHTDRAIKIPLPGPYLLTRSMFVKEATSKVYRTKEKLGDDVIKVLREEIADLIAEGADFIQLDEPVLTEIVFTGGQTRTFMCAALSAGGDPKQELKFAEKLVNAVVKGFEEKVRLGVHVCRGNWSRDESTLLRGSYQPLRPYLEKMKVRQLVLEYATERAGDIMGFGGKEIGLGVVNPRTERVETVEEVKKSVARALTVFPRDKVFLNPDCGFGTFSNRPINSRDVAQAKMKVVAQAARELRAG